jgi:hypothetical protein
MSVDMTVVYRWPLDIYNNVNIGTQTNSSRYVLYALGAGSMYWWAGGIPSDAMSFATSYLVGGVAVYAGAMALSQTSK